MIDGNFWNLVASRWITVTDVTKLNQIREDAAKTAEKTIGKDNEKLLDIFSALDDY